MDATLKKILELLHDERIDRRCAAAMVLGELRAKDAEVIEALGSCLAADNRLLQAYALEALAGVRSAKIASYVTPLLDHPDEEIRAKAGALLANQGARTTASLAKELDGGPVGRRRAIISILARNHDSETLERLLPVLKDPEIGEYTLNALRGETEHMSGEEIEALRTLATTWLKDKEWTREPTGAARLLRLLGYLRDPKLVRTILPFAAEQKPMALRLAALAALRRPLAASKATDEVAHALVGWANDPDPTFARAALDTLRGIKLPADLSRELMALAESQHADVRKFAVEALGRSGNQKVISSLVSHLKGHDPAARDAALHALGRMEGIGASLVKELATCTDAEQVRLLGRLLRSHANELKPAERKAIGELTVATLEEGRPTAEALLEVLAAVDPEHYRAVLFARAMVHKRNKRYEQAFALLGRLEDGGLLDDEGRYAAAVAGLCAAPSKKEFGRASRTTDPTLRQMVELIAKGYPLASKLRREKCLTADDMFFVGFNFVESTDEDEREFGSALLSHLATTAPRSKLGRSARNKLILMGLT